MHYWELIRVVDFDRIHHTVQEVGQYNMGKQLVDQQLLEPRLNMKFS